MPVFDHLKSSLPAIFLSTIPGEQGFKYLLNIPKMKTSFDGFRSV